MKEQLSFADILNQFAKGKFEQVEADFYSIFVNVIKQDFLDGNNPKTLPVMGLIQTLVKSESFDTGTFLPFLRYLNSLEKTLENHWIKTVFHSYFARYVAEKSDWETIKSGFETALNSASALENTGSQAYILNLYGNQLLQRSQFSEAINRFREGISLIKDNKDFQLLSANLLNNIGICFFKLGSLPEALKNYEEALIQYKELSSEQGIERVENNLIWIYFSMEEFDFAERLLLEKIEENQLIDAKNANRFSLVVELYRLSKEYVKAVKLGHKLIEYYKKERNYQKACTAEINLSLCYHNLGDFKLAGSILKEAINLAEKNQYGELLAIGNGNLAGILMETNEYEKAIVYAKKSWDTATANDYLLMKKDSSSHLFKIYKNLEDYENALFWFETFVEQEEKYLSVENQKAVMQQMSRLEFEKREAILAAEAALQQKKAEIEHLKTEELQKAYDSLTKAQEQLIKQEKLASLGQLVSGVAHEIQNPLNFVNNFSELSAELAEEAFDFLDDPQELGFLFEDISANLQKIEHHAKRGAAIVRSMLEYSAHNREEKQQVDVNKLLREALMLAFANQREAFAEMNLHPEIFVQQNIPNVLIPPGEFVRMAFNLITNSLDAIAEQKASNFGAYAPSLQVTISYNSEDAWVQIDFQDNGSPISKELEEKIFEPFFTTKPTGKWVGLGLGIAHDIAVAAGGKLFLINENGGKTFRVLLPAMADSIIKD